ncbi:MAG: 50S ribosomal protein L4 [Candidatus Micrarchaeota archaeon]|nr:50S ribosomal protein L4 [Candidatus Micrarchaeota archaeon]
MQANVLSIDGKVKGSIELPEIFAEQVRPELIHRAVIAEASYRLQPQGHYPLAGMQTTATYYGAMSSYRSGRHMGIAIRPREKLGGGVQGKVKRIPSAVKGKRAHPHLIEKTLIERINKKEYQKALISAISATASVKKAGVTAPIIVSNEIEHVKKTKDMMKILEHLKLLHFVEESATPKIRKGVRRSIRRRIFKRSLLLVLGKDAPAIRASRNIAGMDACTVTDITASALAPGGNPGRITIWSEDAVKEISAAVGKRTLR